MYFIIIYHHHHLCTPSIIYLLFIFEISVLIIYLNLVRGRSVRYSKLGLRKMETCTPLKDHDRGSVEMMIG